MEIDLAAIEANLAEIRRRVGAHKKIIATLKADAYGHGCVEVATSVARAGADYLATGSLAEAARIRAAGVATPMILLGGLVARHDRRYSRARSHSKPRRHRPPRKPCRAPPAQRSPYSSRSTPVSAASAFRSPAPSPFIRDLAGLAECEGRRASMPIFPLRTRPAVIGPCSACAISMR